MDERRIWELDAIRGICILTMVWIHLRYDLQLWWGVAMPRGRLFSLAMGHGAKVFILLSGLCAQLGSRSLKRGCVVLGCGAVISLVTGLTGDQTVIRFGILHLLGTAMILWPLLRRLPWWWLLPIGGAVILAGAWFGTLTVSVPWLYPLGLCRRDFFSADFFPLCPYLGWFLLGGVLGKTVYREKKTLLPRFPAQTWLIRFFRLCGRHSLWIYLLHQPALLAVIQWTVDS